MNRSLHSLIVVSAQGTAREIADVLVESGIDTLWLGVDSLRAFVSALEERDWDIIISEDRLRDLDALDVVGQATRKRPTIPVVVVMNELDSARLLRLFRAGVSDCVLRNDPSDLAEAAGRSLERARAARARDVAEQESLQYRTYLEDLATLRTKELRKINAQLMSEIDLHRATVRALQRSEESFRTLAENAPYVIVRLTADLKIAYANPAWKEMTGFALSQVKGKALDEVGLPERPAKLTSGMFRRAFRTGKTGHVKAAVDLWGKARTYEIAIVPERSETGEIGSALAIMHDVTEAERARHLLQRDKAEFKQLVERRTEELIAARMDLADARRLSDIGTLAATVAHELRNPLAVIQTAVYNIRKKQRGEALSKHLVSIEKKIIESNQIISNLLNYSRLKQPQPADTAIFNLLEENLSSARASHAGHDVGITKRIGSVRGLHVRVDPGQIREVFANIINNAYDAMENNRGRITVTAREGNSGGDLLISFRDNGKGMSEAELRRAPDPFFTTKSKGTGLGLTICRDIVKLHRGSLTIESRQGEGTTVTIALPVR